jgi:hypothetical protein
MLINPPSGALAQPWDLSKIEFPPVGSAETHNDWICSEIFPDEIKKGSVFTGELDNKKGR